MTADVHDIETQLRDLVRIFGLQAVQECLQGIASSPDYDKGTESVDLRFQENVDTIASSSETITSSFDQDGSNLLEELNEVDICESGLGDKEFDLGESGLVVREVASAESGGAVSGVVAPPGVPKDLTCHICGRKYHIHSFRIHFQQCQKLWKARQEKLPKEQRKPCPRLPMGTSRIVDASKRNEIAQKVYNEHALETCPFCNRTFLPESLEKHLPSCARQHHSEWPPRLNTASFHIIPAGQGRNTIICHICGRKYTTHSIDIHLPQCEKLWRQRQERLPKAKQKPLPQMPLDITNSKMKQSRYNALAMKVYQKSALERCSFCDRTFLPESLVKHQPSCERNHQKQHEKKTKNNPRIKQSQKA